MAISEGSLLIKADLEKKDPRENHMTAENKRCNKDVCDCNKCEKIDVNIGVL